MCPAAADTGEDTGEAEKGVVWAQQKYVGTYAEAVSKAAALVPGYVSPAGLAKDGLGST